MPLFSLGLKRLLTRAQRRRYALLQLCFLVAAVVQVISIASVAPFIALLSQPSIVRTQPVIRWLYEAGGFVSLNSFALVFAVALMLGTVAGNIVPAATGYLSWRFVRNLATEVQADVFRSYMYGEYSDGLDLNSAHRINLVTQGVNRLLYNVVLPLTSLISSSLIIVLIALGLLYYDPIVALVASAIIGGGYTLIFRAAKRRLSVHGAEAWHSLTAKQRILAESLAGIKEIRLAGIESVYERRLHDVTYRAFRAESLVGLYGDIPRYALEAMSLCALLALGAFLLVREDSWASIVAVLSVYAMAGYRMLPAAQAAFRAASTIRANANVVTDVLKDVEIGRAIVARPKRQDVHFDERAPIVVENVHFRYKAGAPEVLTGVTFTVSRPGITALVGKSGAGKSTMADLLLGLISPGRGTIKVNGISIHEAARSWQRHVALVSQSVFLIDDTVEANIVFGSTTPVDHNRLERAAKMAHALEFIRALPGGFNFVVGESGDRLSGGQRQRIGIARALYNDAAVIVLDEPTSALDSVAEREVLAALDSLRTTKTIVLITHRLQSLRSADQIIVFDHGRVAGVGSFDALLEGCRPFAALATAL